ncbi:hypothetical protein CBS63078_10813 [Aspergillus niger]|nr:hypothetical protein CBS115989_1141 [Aspergillus niger]KAI2824202.1 hypothetical protein CBS133816_8939 [Aspergillus niger]KAI2834181.1 hypothetical protein CBS11350_10902 [Aspergillus niger]KAI2835554.1 hypothetical protein CBS11232_10451 [Aspergillus niger]KAI2860284.1 hypothetical protein CBS12448_5298 [Aspergillus niger]
MPPQIAFISGPIDTGPNESYFHTHYPPLLTAAIARNDSFVLGPLPYGVDSDALSYLLQYPVSPARITIFVTSREDSLWGMQFRALGVNVHVVEGDSTHDRDVAMTAASTYDILRIRTEEEAKQMYGRLWREGHQKDSTPQIRRADVGQDLLTWIKMKSLTKGLLRPPGHPIHGCGHVLLSHIAKAIGNITGNWDASKDAFRFLMRKVIDGEWEAMLSAVLFSTLCPRCSGGGLIHHAIM